VRNEVTDFGRWTPSWLGLATNQRMEQFLTRFSTIKNFESGDAAGDCGRRTSMRASRLLLPEGADRAALRASCAYPDSSCRFNMMGDAGGCF